MFLIYKNFRIWYFPPPPSNIQTIFIGNSKKKKLKIKKIELWYSWNLILGEQVEKNHQLTPHLFTEFSVNMIFFLNYVFPCIAVEDC